MKFILASKSPQRAEILNRFKVPFEVVPSNIEEDFGNKKRPFAIVKKISYDKALVVAKKYPNRYVIGSDTFVVFSNGKIGLKPKNKKEAHKMIINYSNNRAIVYSGLTLICLNKNVKKIGYEKTTLYFKKLSDDEIGSYLKDGLWKNCSGALKIEEVEKIWIKKRVGDYWNVVGMPINLLKNFINN